MWHGDIGIARREKKRSWLSASCQADREFGCGVPTVRVIEITKQSPTRFGRDIAAGGDHLIAVLERFAEISKQARNSASDWITSSAVSSLALNANSRSRRGTPVHAQTRFSTVIFAVSSGSAIANDGMISTTGVSQVRRPSSTIVAIMAVVNDFVVDPIIISVSGPTGLLPRCSVTPNPFA